MKARPACFCSEFCHSCEHNNITNSTAPLDLQIRHYGQKPIIYVTVDFYEDNLSGGQLPGYQYWLRSVKAEPKYIYGKRPWVFWQYTGTGKIPGIKGKVDINAYRGSRADWKKWLAANSR